MVNCTPIKCVRAVLLVGLFLLHASSLSAGDWQPLFDGKSLDGWTVRGGKATYRVEDGAIVGTTVTGSPNTFLCKGPFADFVLEFEVKCDPQLNSGVQIRSHVAKAKTAGQTSQNQQPESGHVYGYQCEIAKLSTGTAGNFWDEARRNKWLTSLSDEAKKAFKDDDWNKYRIIAQGIRIRSWVNGVPCADFTDDMDASGFIGLQVHSIPKDQGPFEVRWRNLRIRELNANESTAEFEK